jgi:succinate-semialdehyde dehydrogenase/glutarate-semialdehyde dehydrogenase
VLDKFTGEQFAAVTLADPDAIAAAASAAQEAFESSPLSDHRRSEILHDAARAVEARVSEFREAFVAETGFTEREAAVDIQRTVDTLDLCAEEARSLAGEGVPLSGARGQEHRFGFTLRVPVGPVCAITPFNSPLNTVAHKVGPAIAAGNPVVLKPAQATPISAFLLCDAFEGAGLPAGWLNIAFGSGPDIGVRLVDNPIFRFYAFTGSTEVGSEIQSRIGLRRSQMELGAISATIVCEDADARAVVAKAVPASFRKAGQVCTSLQRLMVHESLFDEVLEGVAAGAGELKAGDPRDPDSDIGPMISEAEAERAESWVNEALAAGARSHSDVKRIGPVLSPVVLSDVEQGMKVVDREIFAPVVSVMRFSDFDEALDFVNATPYGLTAGVFTSNWRTAMRAARELDVGVVQIDETSSSRVDLMPYGGTRDSGFGKEGPKYAVEEMTFERLVVFNR